MHEAWHSGILLDMLRWFLVVPIVLLILFLTSSLALAFGMGIETVSSSSHLAADYGPWERLVLRSVSEGILADMKQDDAESSMDIALRLARYDEPSDEGGGFLPPEPEGSTVAAAGEPTPDVTQTEAAVATDTPEGSASPSSTPTASTPTPSATSSLAPSRRGTDPLALTTVATATG